LAFDPAAPVLEIDQVMQAFTAARRRAHHDDLSDLPYDEVVEVSMLMVSTLQRLGPPGTMYRSQAEEAAKDMKMHANHVAKMAPGLLRALREEFAKGRYRFLDDVIRQEVFGDFLSMAEGLLKEAPDAAAVLAGGVLEEHLTKLAAKAGVETLGPNGKGKAVENLAADLVKANVLRTSDHKSITSWYALRTDPAHGRFGLHQAPEVAAMIQGVRAFLQRIPI
jgi:hypothetical protein